MNDIKSNIAANYLGLGCRVFMSVAFVPVYIKYLGIEAYGLIGIFAVLQTSLSLFDMGMRPALGREMARYTGGAHDDQFIWDLLRSIEMLLIGSVVVIALSVWAMSGWLSTNWVRAQGLPTGVVSQVFTLMGLVASVQFFESVYASSLAGLQKQVLQNIVTSIMATVRAVGAVGVLMFVAPSLVAFFIWQGICSVASLVVFRAVVYGALPTPPRAPRFSKMAVLGTWRFAAGMVGITLLALLLTQIDKILLSRLVTLKAFGYYALAGLVSSSLGVLAGPISAAYYPKFTELVVRRDDGALHMAYHQGAQLVTVVVGSAAIVLMAFGAQVLFVWTGDRVVTEQVAPVMSVLALGTLLNCLMWVPYQMQLASGWTSLSITINTAAVGLFVPLILWLVPIYGSISAAWIWVGINGGYCIIGVQFMYRRILTTEKWAWYCGDVMIPLLAACATTVLARIVFPAHFSRVWGLLLLGVISSVALGNSAMAAPLVRRQVLSHLKKCNAH